MKYLLTLTILLLSVGIVAGYEVSVTPMIISDGSFQSSIPNYAPIPEVNYNDTYWNKTTPETVKEFLNIVPVCPWYSAESHGTCGLRTRYLCIEAQSHGLNLNAVTLKYATGMGGSHRIPTFEYSSIIYYCPNLESKIVDNRIVDNAGLHQIIKDECGVESFGFCDYKDMGN